MDLDDAPLERVVSSGTEIGDQAWMNSSSPSPSRVRPHAPNRMNATHPQTAAPASGGSAPGGYWRRGKASNRYSRKRTVVRGSCSRSKARPPSGTGGEGNSRRPGFLRDIQRLLREPQAPASPRPAARSDDEASGRNRMAAPHRRGTERNSGIGERHRREGS